MSCYTVFSLIFVCTFAYSISTVASINCSRHEVIYIISQEAFAMFVAASLLFLLCQSSAEPDKVLYRCSGNDATNRTMTFTPASDGVLGRYTAELCTTKDPRVSSWTIDLSYYDNTAHCGPSDRLRRPDHQHSSNTLNISDPTNCSHVSIGSSEDIEVGEHYLPDLPTHYRHNTI